jgi:hypothetical protein
VDYSCSPQPLIAWFNACCGELSFNVGWLNSSVVVVPGVSAGRASIVLGNGFQGRLPNTALSHTP